MQSDCDGGVRRLCDAAGLARTSWRRWWQDGIQGRGGRCREGEGVEGKETEKVRKEEADAAKKEEESREEVKNDAAAKEVGVMGETGVADSKSEPSETAKL